MSLNPFKESEDAWFDARDRSDLMAYESQLNKIRELIKNKKGTSVVEVSVLREILNSDTKDV